MGVFRTVRYPKKVLFNTLLGSNYVITTPQQGRNTKKTKAQELGNKVFSGGEHCGESQDEDERRFWVLAVPQIWKEIPS